MARWEFKLPDIGEGVTEGEVVQWLVKQGDSVKEDQPMVEVMTDKATVTITSPKAGTVVEFFGAVGSIVQVHSPLVAFELADSTTDSTTDSPSHHTVATSKPPSAAPTNAHKSQGPAATAVGDIKEDLPGMSLMQSRPSTETPSFFAEKVLATPATRKLARDLSIDLRSVPPTGPSGRVTKTDVEQFARATDSKLTTTQTKEPPAHVSAPVQTREPVSIVSTPSETHEGDERRPFVGVRRKIAERMAASKNTAAHFTFVEECDCTELKALRERLKPRAEKAGVKLTYLAFIAKAVIAALRKHPTLNSALDENANEWVIRKNIHLGIAASSDAGLMVPVLRDADKKNLLDLAREIERLGNGARSGKLKPNELSGSTFTITSLGATGGLFATPIINFPEVAILGVHQMKQKPVVRDGAIVIGDVMLLSLSFDHRLIDGHIGAAFAYEVIDFLQNPDRLMLEA